MLIDPHSLSTDLGRLEEIEKVSLRMVIQAIYDYRTSAEEIFREESDPVARTLQCTKNEPLTTSNCSYET